MLPKGRPQTCATKVRHRAYMSDIGVGGDVVCHLVREVSSISHIVAQRQTRYRTRNRCTIASSTAIPSPGPSGTAM